MKNIKVTPLQYEMLIEMGKKNKPPLKPDSMAGKLIDDSYNRRR